MNPADKMAEHIEAEPLEFVRRRVTGLGAFSLHRLRLSRLTEIEDGLDRLRCALETEVLCQSRGNQQQTVQFWVPASWWQHLKYAIGRRCFGIFLDFNTAPWHFGPKLQGTRLKRWLGRLIVVKWRAVNRTVEWEVLDSYPMADVDVPDDFGKPVRIVIEKGEAKRDD